MTYKTIVTHPGKAHLDDLLAVAILAARNSGAAVYRGEPTHDQLGDTETAVVDIGRLHDPKYGLFDHHQEPPDGPPTCAAKLVLDHVTKGELRPGHMDFALPWLHPLCVLDSKGPTAYAEEFGIASADTVYDIQSPLEIWLLEEFATYSGLVGNYVTGLLGIIGTSILAKLQDVTEQLANIDQYAVLSEVDGIPVAMLPDHAVQLEVFNRWVQKFHPETGVIAAHDDRGEGWALYRRNDDPRIDFALLDAHPETEYAAPAGFVLKTKSISDDWQTLVSHAILHPPEVPACG